MAVIENGRVITASPAARADGIELGMRAGGAQALAPSCELLERDNAAERRVRDALTLALFRFTPDIHVEDASSLVLDVGASLTLFGGPVKLCSLVRQCVKTLGVSATIGVGPTAKAAWLLARVNHLPSSARRRRCLRMETATQLLDGLPVSVLPTAAPFDTWLDELGARTLGAIRRLPRVGIIRRTSVQLANEIDLAYGATPEILRWEQVPEQFEGRLDTTERVEHAEALAEGATAVLMQLIGWLTVRHCAATEICLQLVHERGKSAIAPSVIAIAFAQPATRLEHFTLLLKERLAKIALEQPVIGLRLTAPGVERYAPGTLSLFPEPGGSPEQFQRALELVKARLGEERVLIPALVADYRPEVCNAWRSAGQAARAATDAELDVAGEAPLRPFWLLKNPLKLLTRDEKPFYGSALTIIAGPERVEAGWWADDAATRDYYIGQGSDGSRFWVFRERMAATSWFLHGLFG